MPPEREHQDRGQEHPLLVPALKTGMTSLSWVRSPGHKESPSWGTSPCIHTYTLPTDSIPGTRTSSDLREGSSWGQDLKICLRLVLPLTRNRYGLI